MTKIEKMMEESATFTGLCESVLDIGAEADDLWGRIMNWSMNYDIKPEENPFYPELVQALSNLTDIIYDLEGFFTKKD